MSEPWKDWIPGVLSKRQVEELCSENKIENVNNWDSEDPKVNPIGYSSIDLTLSDKGYRMVAGSIKPAGIDYTRTILENDAYAVRLDAVDGMFTLTRGETYVFELKEMLDRLKGTSIYGQATAKSSVGRVDVLARLIVDEMYHYEGFDPNKLPDRHVKMFLEISPITFNVRVKEGISLSQLRLFYGKPGDSQKSGEELSRSVLSREDNQVREADLSVDLSEIEICDGVLACAFAAKKQEEAVDLWKHENESDRPDPSDYWECMQADERKRLLIEKDRFYIIRSKERLSVPEGIAVYAKAMDETIGEMRVHYAGFAHPFFGKNRRSSATGTPLMFEVREHSFPISLRDDEKLARLEFYRMSKDCDPPKESDQGDDYNEQELLLSKFFGRWRSPR